METTVKPKRKRKYVCRSNKSVVDAFYRGEKHRSNTMHSTGDKLYSFSTVIAQRIIRNGKPKIVKNMTKYSQSTSKHQSYVNKYDYILTCEIGRGVTDLNSYSYVKC